MFSCNSTYRLRYWNTRIFNTTIEFISVATVLTACGIETKRNVPVSTIAPDGCNSTYRLRYWNNANLIPSSDTPRSVATVLTACGIETWLTLTASVSFSPRRCNSTYRLRYWNLNVGRGTVRSILLQQYLPLAVLKLGRYWQVYH